MSARSAKNFSTFCIRASLLALVVSLVFAPPVLAKKKKDKRPKDVSELFNPLLGLDYSHWLVGPIADIATLKEIERYLALASDEEAQSFIDAFWDQRAEGRQTGCAS